MEEKDLIILMEALADTEVQLDIVVAERDTLIQQQIPLDARAEIEAINIEYENKIEMVKGNIKVRKDQLQSLLKSFAKPVKSAHYGYSYELEPEWDSNILFELAKEFPKILTAVEMKPKTRLAPRKKGI